MALHPDNTTLLTPMNFVLVNHHGGSRLEVDRVKGVIKVRWVNHVGKDTAIHIIHSLMTEMQVGTIYKILVTREDNSTFSGDAIEWMRNFLLANRYKFNFRISRIAGVTPDAFRANIFANFIKTAVQVIFPGVKISHFEFEESAMEWLI